MSVEAYVQHTLDLLDKERDAEIRETLVLNEKLSAKELERRGVCLLKLQLRSRRSGLYGRMVAVFDPNVKLARSNAKPELPSHNLAPGDIVGVGLMKSAPTDKPLATGVVSLVTSSNISVAFEESQDIFDLNDDDLYKLTKLANDVTYKRLKATLNDLAKYRGGPTQRLIDTFFNLEEVSSPGGEFPITFVNESLDDSQKEAVKFALTQREVAIIHGPPGTGKTTTVVELVIQAVKQGLKILVTAPSNVAVDNLVERLANFKQKIVRIGHPARLLLHLQKYSLDAILSGSDERSIVKDVRTDLQNALAKMKKARGHGERQALKDEMKQLRKEATRREEAATKEVLSNADVVLVTLTSATQDGPLKFLKEDHFDLVVIDEASQALEAACWIGLMRARRCVLAGDHLQLPPVILSKEAASSGLEITLMERLLKTLVQEKGKDIMRMLTVQYRMHADIMAWASHQLYQNKLTAHSSVASHLLRDLNGVTDCEETKTSLLLIDTTGCDLFELDLPEEISKGNEGEADIVAAHVEKLITCGIKPVDIAVIAPYNLQVELLRVRLSAQYPGLEIKSVDGFQGREKEAVIISMVRSNTSREVGFLAEKRRINVAVTRARRHLAIVCDVETVSHDPFIKTLVDYMTEKGEIVTGHQYIEEGKVKSISSGQTRPISQLVTRMSDTKKQAKTSNFKPLQTKEEKMKKYQEQLEKFVTDAGQLVIDFPSSLNSHDRLAIHEVAEKLGLSHISTGEGSNRVIQVSKVKVDRVDGTDSQGTSSDSQQPSAKLPAPTENAENTNDTSVVTEQSNASVITKLNDISVITKLNNASVVTDLNDTSVTKQNDSSVTKLNDTSVIAEPNDTSIVTKLNYTSVITNLNDASVITDLNDASVVTELNGNNNKQKDPSIESKYVTSEQNKDVSVDGQVFAHASKEILSGNEDLVTNVEIKSHKNRGNIKQKLTSSVSETVQLKTETCKHCQKSILCDNLIMHELHCSKQQNLATATFAKGKDLVNDVKKKEIKTKEKKEKPKKSHVQKASDVLSKIDGDDFDALITTITELDSKCAFKKCKTLTNTLGRNCEYCTRRFCLTHLMPEIHGCGDAAKVEARRTISKEGVLHRGSGVPNKKPSEARRAQLESKMEKKLGELAGKRSRNN